MTRRLLRTRTWHPPAAPPDGGRSAVTTELTIARRLPTGGHGPEDVVFDDDGWVVTGLQGGDIVRIDPATGRRELLGCTRGRPLGLEPLPGGAVLVCDHDRGLLRMSATGEVEVLVNAVDTVPLSFASNVAQGPDGTIWFTTSTSRWDLEHYLGDMFEHSCTGRLLQRDPDGTVTTLLDDLKFGNGVVVAPDGSHVLFAETAGYRICRRWVTGPRAGSTQVLVSNLPGFPDNLSLGSDGLLWVAMVAPRNALLDAMLPRPGFLRTLVWNLPDAFQPAAAPISWVMAFDLDGTPVHDLRSTHADYGFVTGVAERDGVLVAGSTEEGDVVVLDRPAG